MQRVAFYNPLHFLQFYRNNPKTNFFLAAPAIAIPTLWGKLCNPPDSKRRTRQKLYTNQRPGSYNLSGNRNKSNPVCNITSTDYRRSAFQ